jgi:hypothetical protein
LLDLPPQLRQATLNSFPHQRQSTLKYIGNEAIPHPGHLLPGDFEKGSCWRTAAGAEVDIVLAESGRLIPLEVATTPRPAMARNLTLFKNDLETAAAPG